MNDNVTIIEQKELLAVSVGLRSDGILHLVFKELEELSPEMAGEIFQAEKELGKGKQFPVLITVNKYMHIGEETRRLWADPKINCYSSAEAMVLYNPAIKLIGNFFIQFHKPPRPTRMFNSEDKALEWLRNLKVTKK